MKFGHNLPRNQVPEWASSCINYKGLKKLIKNAAEASKNGSDPDLTGQSTGSKIRVPHCRATPSSSSSSLLADPMPIQPRSTPIIEHHTSVCRGHIANSNPQSSSSPSIATSKMLTTSTTGNMQSSLGGCGFCTGAMVVPPNCLKALTKMRHRTSWAPYWSFEAQCGSSSGMER